MENSLNFFSFSFLKPSLRHNLFPVIIHVTEINSYASLRNCISFFSRSLRLILFSDFVLLMCGTFGTWFSSFKILLFFFEFNCFLVCS